jgi:hypothetical protein
MVPIFPISLSTISFARSIGIIGIIGIIARGRLCGWSGYNCRDFGPGVFQGNVFWRRDQDGFGM